MTLKSLRIENFRSFRDGTIQFDDYTCLVGANGAGKSTVLAALNVFFVNHEAPHLTPLELQRDDFHFRDTSSPVRLTLTFEDLSESAQKDFATYYRQGQLRCLAIATWDEASGRAKVSQHGERMGMEEFRSFFEALKAGQRVDELKAMYQQLRGTYNALPDEKTKPKMELALREYEDKHPERCVPIASSDNFYGWTKGANLLAKYVTWVYLPAVKDAGTEQEYQRGNALSRLLDRVVGKHVELEPSLNELRSSVKRELEKLLTQNRATLGHLSESLASRLRNWANPAVDLTLQWRDVSESKSLVVQLPGVEVALGEGGFSAPVVRAGHGVQRAYLLALLEELSANANDSNKPKLLLAIEEPELFQHPPQARHLASVLQKLSGKDAQVFVSTHSPYLVTSAGFESVRLVRRNPTNQTSTAAGFDHKGLTQLLASALGEESGSPQASMARAAQILQVRQNEMFFAVVPVLVEGAEDEAYIWTHLNLKEYTDEFRALGCHIIPMEGKTNMSRPLAIARGLRIPVFAVFDGDSGCSPEKEAASDRDNKCLLRLCGCESPAKAGDGTYWGDEVVMWKRDIAEEVVSSFGHQEWKTAEDAARGGGGLNEGIKRKNPVLIAAPLEKLAQQGRYSPELDRLCNSILQFAKRQARPHHAQTVAAS